jgi:antitoxin FitA
MIALMATWKPDTMASITIRKLDNALKAKLRLRAARQGCSMEEAARDILRAALAERTRRPANLADAIRHRFEPLGGVDIALPPRETLRDPPFAR